MSTALKSYGRDAVALGWLRRSASLWLCLFYLVLLISGFLAGGRAWPQLMAIAGLLVGAGLILADRVLLRGEPAAPPEGQGGLARLAAAWDRTCADLEVGALLLVIAYAFLQIAGPLAGPLYPLVYILIAFMVTFQDRRTGWVLVGLAIAIEVTSFISGVSVGASTLSAANLVLHVTFIGVFGALNQDFFARADLEKLRQQVKERTDAQSAEVRRTARELGLEAEETDADAESREEAEARLIVEAIDAVDTSVETTMRLLKAGLGCRTVALLWFDATGRRLRIRDALSDGSLAETLHPGEGALAGVLRRREPVVLNDLRRGYRGLAYYDNPEQEPVRAFCGVPLIEGDAPVGALCLDRSTARPFTPQEAEVVSHAAESIVRTVQTERFLISMERMRHEVSRFYEASRQLNHALTPEQVYAVALGCVADLCHFDLGAVVLRDAASGDFHVTRAEAPERAEGRPSALAAFAERLDGASFAPNSGLVTMAVDMAHYLPYNGDYHASRSVVFSRELQLEGVQSLLVLPLIAHDEPLGAFVVACRDRGAFPRGRREMIEVIANQVAISLHNARMYDQMEQMATTDGLTGLSNHRTFQNRMSEAIARADRSTSPLTMLLTDIDHFKSINDTYGHPVGDEVLRQVSATFVRVLRQTDIPARYGGEEFAVVLENTGREEASQIAERLRAEVEALEFQSAGKTFSISMSFGVGQYPEDGQDKATLIDHADQALYYAKSHGRNQVRAWHDVQHAPDLGAPKPH